MADRVNPFKGKVDESRTPETKPHNNDELMRALSVLVDPGGLCEVRSLKPARSAVLAGADTSGLCTAAERFAQARGVYLCLNPLRADFANPEGAASDDDIVRRRWLFMDLDSIRPDPKECCATDDEKAEAAAQKDALRDELTSIGWPEPIEVDSGNGFYLLYRIDLPNDEPSRLLIRRLLHRLSEQYPKVKLDRAVHNASRIARLPGTWNRKGKDSPSRPHRMCRLVRVPENLAVVDVGLLVAAAGVDAPNSAPPPNGQRKNPFKGSPTDSRLLRYAQRVLNDEVLGVAMAVRGHQGGHGGNNTLNEASFSVGTILHWGVLDEATVIEQLTTAAQRAGLDDGEILPTINSGLTAGKGSPRPQPEWAAHETNGKHTPAGKEKTDGKPAEEPQQQWSVLYDGEVIAEGTPDEVRAACPDDREQEDGSRVKTFELATINAILNTHYPEPRWIIPGVMSEGLNILAGAPKQGKSILSLNLALTVAGGGMAMGDTRVEAADVLYLSLEDQQRRVKERAVKMLRVIEPKLSGEIGSRLVITTEWPRQDAGGLRMIDFWASRAKNPGLVIIDVWNRFSPAYRVSGNAYHQDADFMSEVKRYVERRGFSSLIVHHTRKPGLKEPEDFVAEISGTMGLSGTADGILVLVRSRGEKRAALHITGRDVSERELVLEFDEATLTWRSLGTKSDHVSGRVQEKVVQYLRSNRPTAFFVKDIAGSIEEKDDSVKHACANLMNNKIIRKIGHAYSYPGEAFDEKFEDEGEVQ